VTSVHDALKKKHGEFINIQDVKALIHANEKKPKTQGWTFTGDWKNSVQPYW
jgi:hypothetical protein